MAGEFDLTLEQMREYGYCVIDTLVDHWLDIRGRTVLRMCTIQPTTTEDDLCVTLDCLLRCAAAGR